MRLTLTLALATVLTATCQLQTGAAAPGLPTQAASQTKCGIAAPAVSSGNPAAPSADLTCGERLDWRLSQHGPGFWASDPAASAPAGVTAASPPTVLRAPPSEASANESGCMNYQVMVVISGEPREATVVACPEPDGSWQVTQYTPGLPTQSFAVPPPPAAAGSANEFGAWGPAPAWDWAAAGPWFFGFAPVVVMGPAFHRFHHFGHGFARGFAHGFAVGHGVGLGHGFAVGHNFPAGRGFTVGLRPGFMAGSRFAGRHR